MGTFATLFSGGEGAGWGARAAGLKDTWGIEINPKLAAIAKLNSFDTFCADACDVDWAQLDRPDWLHASPPCVNASVANHTGGESTTDRNLGAAICNAIKKLKPQTFSLENVSGYKDFHSFSLIQSELLKLGYTITMAVLDAADYGVAQNRKRLFLVASLNGSPRLPQPTHQRASEQLGLWTLPHIGWAEVLEDLPQPKEYKLSDRMIAMIPDSHDGTALMSGFHQYTGRGQGGLTVRKPSQPSPTLLAKFTQPSCSPLIVDGCRNAKTLGVEHMAALQSFPRECKWGNNPSTAKMAIGNAVAPKMMQAIITANS
jgi:DNA (cytosine-5)-methyltransferase 1